jgi:hypothetical protein
VCSLRRPGNLTVSSCKLHLTYPLRHYERSVLVAFSSLRWSEENQYAATRRLLNWIHSYSTCRTSQKNWNQLSHQCSSDQQQQRRYRRHDLLYRTHTTINKTSVWQWTTQTNSYPLSRRQDRSRCTSVDDISTTLGSVGFAAKWLRQKIGRQTWQKTSSPAKMEPPRSAAWLRSRLGARVSPKLVHDSRWITSYGSA